MNVKASKIKTYKSLIWHFNDVTNDLDRIVILMLSAVHFSEID